MGHDPRATPPALCFLSGRAGSLPSDAAMGGPRGLRPSSVAVRPPPPSPPTRAASPPPPPRHSPCVGLRATPAREGRGLGLSPPRAGSGSEPRAGVALPPPPPPPPPRGSSLFLQHPPSVAWTRRSSGSGRREARGGAEEEAEGGPEAAGANAARRARPSSPHASSGGGQGHVRGPPGRAQRGLERREVPLMALAVASAEGTAWLPRSARAPHHQSRQVRAPGD